jgi:uncharacterized small protein (DUF1192 family)
VEASRAKELETLKARVAALEEEIARARSLPAAAGPAAVFTRAARDAGARAAPGAGDAAEVKLLQGLFQRREAPVLVRELGSLLARGDAGHATLYDFLSDLDRESREALILTFDYRFSFSLAHLAVLHGDELARFAHYFLAATRDAPRSTLRRTLFDYLPVFLRYHKGRYPDLERDIEEEILRHLREPRGNLQVYYGAMDTLGYRPPIEVFDPLLEAAMSHAEILPVVLHLQARNNSAAVAILARNILRVPAELEWKAEMLLDGLARMSAPEAARALRELVRTSNENLSRIALLAYLAVPRDQSSLPLLEEFLGSGFAPETKRPVIRRLRERQPALVEALRGRIDKLPPEIAQELIGSGGTQRSR